MADVARAPAAASVALAASVRAWQDDKRTLQAAAETQQAVAYLQVFHTHDGAHADHKGETTRTRWYRILPDLTQFPKSFWAHPLDSTDPTEKHEFVGNMREEAVYRLKHDAHLDPEVATCRLVLDLNVLTSGVLYLPLTEPPPSIQA